MSLTTDQKVEKLWQVAFPNGVLVADDDGLAIAPDPSTLSVTVGESVDFAVTGIDADERIYVWSSPDNIAHAQVHADTRSGFTITGKDAGPAGARAMISVTRLKGQGVFFYVNVLPKVA